MPTFCAFVLKNRVMQRSLGLNATRIRLTAFVISGAIIIGGVGRLFGLVVGALVFVALEHLLGGLSDFWHICLGIMLLLIVLFGKGGVIGMIRGREEVYD